MGYFVRKQKPVEALQYDGTEANAEGLAAWMRAHGLTTDADAFGLNKHDWIVRDGDGFQKLSSAEFGAKYEYAAAFHV